MAASFTPKQHITLSAADLAELQGNGSTQAIKFALSLISPFTLKSIIHDNGCGAGAVSEVIFTSEPSPPTGLRIHATDINPQFVEGTRSLAQAKDWPITAEVMDARELSFGDEFFTHSITAFVFHGFPEAERATREIRRTLQPGGVALVTIWSSLPHIDVLQHAHWATRGKDGPMPLYLPEETLLTGEDLKKMVEAGGFSDVNVHEVVAKVRITDLERWAQLAWSFLGRLPEPEPWKTQDEEKWDETIKIIVDGMQGNGNMERGSDGNLYMRVVGNVAVAKK
ncbi:S-adenosyl-L-methionine-dependent methyltransferase [Dendryphion nanum]|uniref:S-adenosyl-L-methionine-dependent methyltransferase n=1 Tax=Dendryphion nanum TaxID=256645 RepID=A0A9P9IDT1_9PLEO|nr:S-adenosyl-L-methionine-dependent methyltransferase [Dendryphion nanum]